jgi:hypothetical protein
MVFPLEQRATSPRQQQQYPDSIIADDWFGGIVFYQILHQQIFSTLVQRYTLCCRRRKSLPSLNNPRRGMDQEFDSFTYVIIHIFHSGAR